MFDYLHYIPILRWKRAEWIALRKLFARDAPIQLITPLLEIIPRTFYSKEDGEPKDVAEVLSKVAEDILQNWGQDPFYVDLLHIPVSFSSREKRHPIEVLYEQAQRRRLALIPVTGLGRDKKYQSAIASIVKRNGLGACLRVFSSEIGQSNLAQSIDSLLTELNLSYGEVDFIVDFQYISNYPPSLSSILSQLPNISDWRSLIFASGAFPENLTGFAPGEHKHPRLDWLSWKMQVTNGNEILRLPSYADYTIQHPIYREPPDRSNPSASIRYASEEDWVIMRGEGINTKGGPGRAQWPANALLLTERSEFLGPKFSYGDAYIYEMSQQIEKTGNPETWLRAGINHHISMVMYQLANLPVREVSNTP